MVVNINSREKDDGSVLEKNDGESPNTSDAGITAQGIVGVPPRLKPAMMDDLWARELLELEFEERQANEENLHGIRSQAVNETEEVLYKGLNEMQKEIDNIPDHEKLSHIRGLQLGSLYIQSLAFRLKFLRSVQFEPKVAARRYVKSLDILSEDFGEYALMRRLYITDLGKEEMDYMKKGQYQILPSRDVLGRRIAVYNIHPTTRTYSIDVMFKVYFYMLFGILSEDISTQKHGMVYIGILAMNKKYMNKVEYSTVNLKGSKLYLAVPLYWGAVHLCVPDDGLYRLVTAFFMAWIGKVGRKVMRIHHGNRMECNYMLSSFGIPLEDLPYMYSGVIKTKNHLKLMKVRTSMDDWEAEQKRRSKIPSRGRNPVPESMKPFPGIECPEVNFVVLPGKRIDGVQINHPGYVAFRKIMAENEGFKSYLLEDSFERCEVVEVVEDVLYDACMHGLQFLVYNRDKGYYTEVVNENELKENIEQVMRHYKKTARAKLPCDKTNHSSKTSLHEPLDLSEKSEKNCSDCF